MREENLLLASLPDAERERLEPYLREVVLGASTRQGPSEESHRFHSSGARHGFTSECTLRKVCPRVSGYDFTNCGLQSLACNK